MSLHHRISEAVIFQDLPGLASLSRCPTTPLLGPGGWSPSITWDPAFHGRQLSTLIAVRMACETQLLEVRAASS